MSEHSAAADEVAPFTTEEEPPNDGLHQRMSGYGYQSPPPSLLGVDSKNGHDSSEASGQSQNGAAPSRTFGYQKPSHAWQAATQAWRTRTEELPSGVEQTSSDVEQHSSDVEQVYSEVDQDYSHVEAMRLEIEHAQARLEEAEADVEPTPLDAGDTSPEAAEARLRSVPATRSFWSRISGSGSPEAIVYPSTAESPSSEADSESATPDAGQPEPVVEGSAPDFDVMFEVVPEAVPAPEPSVPGTDAAQEDPETPGYPDSSSTASAASGCVSAPPQSPAPAMHDVRLIVQAVESAEGAAMAYAREIGEARRHLSEAIAQFDQAEAARTVLNRLAAGFGPQASPGSGSLD